MRSEVEKTGRGGEELADQNTGNDALSPLAALTVQASGTFTHPPFSPQELQDHFWQVNPNSESMDGQPLS